MYSKFLKIIKVTVVVSILANGIVGCYQPQSSSHSTTDTTETGENVPNGFEDSPEEEDPSPRTDSTELPNPDPPNPPKKDNIGDEAEETRVEVYRQANPSVVSIRAGNSIGSGFIVQSNGIILTNTHVVEEAQSPVTVIISDGRELLADVIAYHPNADLAALKIRDGNNFPPLLFARENQVRVGQSVYAIGSPLGLRNTFTQGIVSRIEANNDLIQHDAAINPGNSGGPLLNSQAEVIGINTFIRSVKGGSDGLGFAITSDVLEPFLAEVQQLPDNPDLAIKPTPPPSPPSPDPEPINPSPEAGSLVASFQEGDPTLPNGSYFHAYPFKGQAGTVYEIEMTSNEIDPSLLIFSQEREEIIAQNDDMSPGNFNAKLQVELPENGEYIIIARAYSVGETGEYKLTIKQGNISFLW